MLGGTMAVKRLAVQTVFGRQGFTLGDRAVVLVLMGLLTAAAVPGLREFYARHALRAAACQMAADIRTLQSEAAGCRSEGLTGERSVFMVTFYAEIERYGLQRTGDGAWSRFVELPRGVDLVGTTFTGGRMYLSYAGTPSSGGGTVTLASKATGDLLYVIVHPTTGRVRVSGTPPESWEVGR